MSMRKSLLAGALAIPLFLAGCGKDGSTIDIGFDNPAFKAWAKSVQDSAVLICGYQPGLSFLLGVFGQGAIGGVAEQVCAAITQLPPVMARRGAVLKEGLVVVRIGGVPFDPGRDGRFVR
jgi:hypothetical protein